MVYRMRGLNLTKRLFSWWKALQLLPYQITHKEERDWSELLVGGWGVGLWTLHVMIWLPSLSWCTEWVWGCKIGLRAFPGDQDVFSYSHCWSSTKRWTFIMPIWFTLCVAAWVTECVSAWVPECVGAWVRDPLCGYNSIHRYWFPTLNYAYKCSCLLLAKCSLRKLFSCHR